MERLLKRPPQKKAGPAAKASKLPGPKPPPVDFFGRPFPTAPAQVTGPIAAAQEPKPSKPKNALPPGGAKERRSKTGQNQLVEIAGMNGVGEKKLRRLVKELKSKRQIEAVRVPRAGAKSAIAYKASQKKERGPK